MTTQIKIRRDTAANWTSINPVLAVGELGLETDTRKAKFGDGATAWNSLAGYLVAPDSSALTAATSFAGDVSGLYNALIVAKASNSFALPNDVTITTTGTLDDYALSANAAVLRWNGASDLSLSGITGGADGRVLLLVNVTAAQTLTIKHDVTSTAANRFYCPEAIDLAMTPFSGVLLIYDSTLTRWEVFGPERKIENATVWNAKGDILAATGDNAATRLGVGANDQVLTADSAQATGLKWAAAVGGGGGSATYAGTWRYPGI